MELVPAKEDWSLAREIFTAFKLKPESYEIASVFSLAHLLALLNKVKPKTVLEFGTGIGTITHTLLNHPSHIEEVVSTEDSEVCLEQLAKNIPEEFLPRLTLVKNVNELLDYEKKYDLVIFDGGFFEPEEYRFLKDGTACFIEGERTPTRTEAIKALAANGLKIDFVNYNRGIKTFAFSLKRKRGKGLPKPKFTFRKKLKGCWIGRVSALGS